MEFFCFSPKNYFGKSAFITMDRRQPLNSNISRQDNDLNHSESASQPNIIKLNSSIVSKSFILKPPNASHGAQSIKISKEKGSLSKKRSLDTLESRKKKNIRTKTGCFTCRKRYVLLMGLYSCIYIYIISRYIPSSALDFFQLN